MELAPLVGLADAIVDLVSTGGTLKANNLVAVEEILPISSRLVVNQAALKVKPFIIQSIINAFSPVSYTHLDVYKRQVQGSGCFVQQQQAAINQGKGRQADGLVIPAA